MTGTEAFDEWIAEYGVAPDAATMARQHYVPVSLRARVMLEGTQRIVEREPRLAKGPITLAAMSEILILIVDLAQAVEQ